MSVHPHIFISKTSQCISMKYGTGENLILVRISLI